jgi:hypothetical protein
MKQKFLIGDWVKQTKTGWTGVVIGARKPKDQMLYDILLDVDRDTDNVIPAIFEETLELHIEEFESREQIYEVLHRGFKVDILARDDKVYTICYDKEVNIIVYTDNGDDADLDNWLDILDLSEFKLHKEPEQEKEKDVVEVVGCGECVYCRKSNMVSFEDSGVCHRDAIKFYVDKNHYCGFGKKE